jgi:NADPH-dependent glutamate synthase beta subunit-like oxidoreductase
MERGYEILASTNNFPEFTGRICGAMRQPVLVSINPPLQLKK